MAIDWSLAYDLRRQGLTWNDIGKIYRTSGGSVSRAVKRDYGYNESPPLKSISEYSDLLISRMKDMLDEKYGSDEDRLNEMLKSIYNENTVYTNYFLENEDSGSVLNSVFVNTLMDHVFHNNGFALAKGILKIYVSFMYKGVEFNIERLNRYMEEGIFDEVDEFNVRVERIDNIVKGSYEDVLLSISSDYEVASTKMGNIELYNVKKKEVL